MLEIIETPAYNDTSAQPFLTVGIPTWNRAERLIAQLESITAQISDKVEVLVVDNHSNDETWARLSLFAQSNSTFRFRFLRNATNLGADVNYLRVFEFATGRWVWLMGDDDPVNFSNLQTVLGLCEHTQADVLLIFDPAKNPPLADRALTRLSAKEFLDEKFDVLGILLYKVGSVCCKAASAHIHLRDAYQKSIGLLHSYSILYGALIESSGIEIASIPDFYHDVHEEPNRWKLMKGNIGAWSTSLLSFPHHEHLARAREVRQRQSALLASALLSSVNKRPIDWEDAIWMLRAFNYKGKIALLLVIAFSAINPKLLGATIQKLFPSKWNRIQKYAQHGATENY